MTNEEAYSKLLTKRPVIVAVLLRDKPRFGRADMLASSIASQNDSPELVQLIKQSAEHIFECGLTMRALDSALPEGHSGSSLTCPHPFCVSERTLPSQ